MRWLSLVVLMAGCAGNPSLSSDQLREMAKDKNFTAYCLNVAGVAGVGKTVYANVDRTVVVNGSITVSPDCTITLANEPVPKAVTK